MIAKSLLVAAATVALSAGPTTATQAGPAPGEPTAAAWLVDVTVSAGSAAGVQLATARAQSGSAAQAWGAPVTVNGTSYQGAGATTAHPSGSSAAVDWTDQTGSLTVNGGFTRAEVGGGSAEVSTGLAAGSGSGFAMASKLLTWDQQKRLMDQFMAVNDAVFDPLNARVQALRPVLEAAGLQVPTLTKMSALALIDVGSGDVANASAATVSGSGMSSAKATATLSGIQLLDGFLRLDDVAATAGSESVGGDEARTASVRVGRLSLAGVDVTLDQDGLQAAGTSALRKAVVQPALDELASALADNGVTLAVDETRAVGDLRQATAFRLTVAAPSQTLTISIGHVEASAATVAGPAVVEPPAAAPPPAELPPPYAAPPAPVVAPVTAGGSDQVSLPELGDTGPVPPGTSTPVAVRHGIPRWLGASPPAAAARALGTVFLLLLLAGVGTALVPVLLMRPRPAPRRLPLIDPEVLP